ncbi:MAG: stage V sporulation protein AD [Turicibacter sp.]|nr:stage V sporulation protein AD [Turicibacter sp.]
MKEKGASFKLNHVYLESTATVVGAMEMNGPLSSYFDIRNPDPYFGKKSWEQAETAMSELAILKAMVNAGVTAEDVDFAFGGDLVNQLVPTHYAMREFDIPFIGTYSACATVVESLILASTFVDHDYATRALAFSSSHNNMAEKQFRTPVEYGAAKGATAQYTATGAGVGIVSQKPSAVKIESATIGIIVDAEQNNPSDMGTAMAPAAAHTISTHLKEMGLAPDHYDLILTGDLASVGSPILIDLLKQDGYDISGIHQDCGLLLYDDEQPTFAGGSGAGCCSIVMFGYIAEKLRRKELKNVLVVATGALLNATIVAQKESIPGIAHAIALSSAEVKGGEAE